MDYDQTHWAPVRRRQPLPTFYYHGHFVEMLDFVAARYAHVLLDCHLAYLESFRSLPVAAQCLYVRIVNRKGSVFAARQLRYPELGDPRPLIGLLAERGFLGSPGPEHLEDVLAYLTRNDIYCVLLPRFAGLPRTLRKPELIEFAVSNMAPADFLAAALPDSLLIQRRVDETRFLLFLYFGRIREELSQFTMRDLGLVRTQDSPDDYEPRFCDRAEAFENYYFALRLHAYHDASDREMARLLAELPEWPEANFAGSAALRDELALKLGRRAEKDADTAAAEALYRTGESAECMEHLVRLLLSAGRRDEARQHLEACLDKPLADEQWFVARDLYERRFNGKRTSALTDTLRSAESIDIDESKSGSPEKALIDYYEEQNIPAFRTENQLWRNLFALMFWDELFVDGDSNPHSPFEYLPGSLANGSFYIANRERIEERLAELQDTAAARRRLLKAIAAHYGTPNGIFRWRQSMGDALFALLDHADPAAIARVVRQLARNYPESRYGYPDLMLVDKAGVRFVEVKAEGDQLRRNQLLRLRQLRDAGFRADVIRVHWVLDPLQTYVVVDVETTGGTGENHRVTEIGAVRVRDGKVVDRFETLLNPQRTIPPGITRLTGITPAMVSDAPYFADIADRLESFLRGAIFVAHNVEFDYGFIGREFRRVGRSFRMPKLCTCASMRRLYPGHRSYSLASLCRDFGIRLARHHRALCDAEAAAELLLLVNEKRRTNA